MSVTLVDNVARPLATALSLAFSADAYGKLDGYGILGAAADPDAAIKALFANSEQGAFYDPSDLTTMFQDRIGTTVFTAVGQTNGLIFDKSKGLVLGSEKVANGDFSNGATGWSTIAGSWSITGGAAVNTGAVANENLGQNIPSTIGRTYKFTITINSVTGSGINCYVFGNYTGNLSVSGTYTFYITSLESGTFFIICTNGSTCSIDNLTVKELTGNHAVAPSNAARPVVANNVNTKPFRDFDLVDDNMVTTFPSSLGSTCTVGRSSPTDGAVILTNQTIGTTYTANADDCALVITNDALTTQETANLTDWLNKKAGFFF